jgi:hypothetical protein
MANLMKRNVGGRDISSTPFDHWIGKAGAHSLSGLLENGPDGQPVVGACDDDRTRGSCRNYGVRAGDAVVCIGRPGNNPAVPAGDFFMRVWPHRQESEPCIIALEIVAPVSLGVLVLLDEGGLAGSMLRDAHEAQLMVKREGLRMGRSRTQLSKLRPIERGARQA